MSDLLYDLPNGGIGLLLTALLGSATWLLWRALPNYRALRAIRSASLVTVNSNAQGLVKVKGTAHPANVPEGYGIPRLAWSEESRSYRPGFSSGTRSVAKVSIRDETGECLLHSEESRVVPSGLDVETDRRIFGDDLHKLTRFIRTGDLVFGIGILGRDKALPGQNASRRLRPASHGLLILSGKNEQGAALYFQMRMIPPLSGAAICLGLAGWVWWVRPLF